MARIISGWGNSRKFTERMARKRDGQRLPTFARICVGAFRREAVNGIGKRMARKRDGHNSEPMARERSVNGGFCWRGSLLERRLQ
jgi:hypothetical protein